ncbi:MAG TPA: class I poly(R)-hydroxyalkanoic acid synthase [Burkholderiales bacterium]
MQPSSPEALLAAIAQSGNEVTQGWMRLFGAAPALVDEFPRQQALHAAYLEKQSQLWQAMLAGRRETLIEDGDKRFASREWHDNPYYDYLRQSYLLAAQYLQSLVDSAPLEGAAKERARFAARQWLDALCPANFASTNPAVLRAALETQGESLARGLANLLADARKGRISQTDESAFELGRNLATTPGDVVYENELMQLIQYRPATDEVAKRPLVMIPPCINKYYILDLQPENSFVGHAVVRGHTVFMVSWRNVGPEQGHLGWDDYLELGVFSALRAAREICGVDKVNALGFCVGGTLLGAGLAVLARKGEDIVGSVTLLAAMLDFSETGPIGLFVDEASVAAREAALGRGGILSGSELAFVFSAVRANDLVWPYVVNNYLLGGRPAAFDLLYWNADSTNLPGPMYCYYLRNTYLENRLRVPDALSQCGVPVDLGRVELPLFALATREDHIVPWRSAYRSLHLLGGADKTFVLGASGHIAGVVNPASKNRRSYWTGAPYPENPDDWLATATERKGSWWPAWDEWLARHGGGARRAPARPGSVKYQVIEAAPGRYVRQRIS